MPHKIVCYDLVCDHLAGIPSDKVDHQQMSSSQIHLTQPDHILLNLIPSA